MGNNPSKGSPGDAPSPAGSPKVTGSGNERKVIQQPSISTLSGATTKASALDPSASTENATGYSAAQNQAIVEQRLQSSQPSNPSSPIAARTSELSGHHGGNQDAGSQSKDIPNSDSSNPVQVPRRPSLRRDTLSGGIAPQSYYNASAHLQRPPRLPLPIGDATATPGSPVLRPEDSHIGGGSARDRFTDEHPEDEPANFGSVPVDEDEGAEDLQPYTPSGVGKPVPTVIEWASHGDKVYVTGTFVNWEKKFRLHRRYVTSPSAQLFFESLYLSLLWLPCLGLDVLEEDASILSNLSCLQDLKLLITVLI